MRNAFLSTRGACWRGGGFGGVVGVAHTDYCAPGIRQSETAPYMDVSSSNKHHVFKYDITTFITKTKISNEI